MNKIIASIICIFLYIPVLVGHAETGSDLFKDYIVSEFERLNQGITDSILQAEMKTDPRKVTYYAALSAKLYTLTGESGYLNISENTYRLIISYWSINSQSATNGFFIYAPFLEAYQILRDANRVECEDEDIARLVNASANGQKGDDNQVFSRCRGLAKALVMFPQSSYAPAWRSYITEIWNDFLSVGYVNENAAGYNGIGLYAMADVASIMGWSHQLPEKLYTDYAAQIAPSGALPEYGDDYFCAWYFAVGALRQGAHIFNRKDLSDLADLVFKFGTKNYSLTLYAAGRGNLEQLMQVYSVALASEIVFSGSDTRVPKFESQITTRVTPEGETVANKLIMHSKRAFLMTELYPKGSHAHLNRTGAILYYELNKIPLFHGMARHNKSATAANVPLVLDGEINVSDSFAPEIWRTERIPLSFVSPGKESILISKLTFRIEGKKDIVQSFFLDNIRLVGRNGTLMLDDLDDMSNWRRSDSPYMLSTARKTQGNSSLQMRIGYNDGGYFYNSPNYNRTILLNEYDTILFDWAYTSQTNKQEFSFAFRMYDNNNDIVDFNPGDTNISAKLLSAEVENHDGYSAAVLHYGGFFAFDTTLTRTIVLTDDGTIITADTVNAGESADALKALSIWQLYDTAQNAGEYFCWSGENKQWYDGDGNQIPRPSVALKMFGGDGTASTAGYTVTNSTVASTIAFTGKLLQSGESTTLLSVITPFISDEAMASIIMQNGAVVLSPNQAFVIDENQIVRTDEAKILEDSGGIYGKCTVVSSRTADAIVILARYNNHLMEEVYFEKTKIIPGVNSIETARYANRAGAWKMFVLDEYIAPLVKQY